jgi:hypothetical protein
MHKLLYMSANADLSPLYNDCIDIDLYPLTIDQ